MVPRKPGAAGLGFPRWLEESKPIRRPYREWRSKADSGFLWSRVYAKHAVWTPTFLFTAVYRGLCKPVLVCFSVAVVDTMTKSRRAKGLFLLILSWS